MLAQAWRVAMAEGGWLVAAPGAPKYERPLVFVRCLRRMDSKPDTPSGRQAGRAHMWKGAGASSSTGTSAS